MPHPLRDKVGTFPTDIVYVPLNEAAKTIGLKPHELLRLAKLYPHGTVASNRETLYNTNYYDKICKEDSLMK
jgi:hypothetical protein